MAETIKLTGSEIELTTANTVGNATLVRLFNNTAGQVLITHANDTETLGTVTMGAGHIEYLIKLSTDTVASNAAIRAVGVAFT